MTPRSEQMKICAMIEWLGSGVARRLGRGAGVARVFRRRSGWLIVAWTCLVSGPLAAEANPFVRLDYNLTLDSRSRNAAFIELFDDRPLTRDNFLLYVDGGLYDETFMHRLARNFVLQGGGFYPEFVAEPPPVNVSLNPNLVVDLDGNLATDNPQVMNEFNKLPMRSNVRGTLAMAKLAPPSQGGPPNGGPNSATNQWFVNLANNGGTSPSGLDFQNGGFTVFAQVVGDGMVLFDAFNTLQIFDYNPDINDDGIRDGGPFGGTTNDGVPALGSNLVLLEKAARVDYFGAGSTTNVPGTGKTFTFRDAFVDTGAAFTGGGRLIVNVDRTLGVREGISLSQRVRVLGKFSPGLQIGRVTVPGYDQSASGTLEIDIRGTTVDTEYDQLVVNGLAQLSGKLKVTLLNLFNPRPGNRFTLLTSTTNIVGSFQSYDLPTLSPGYFWNIDATATSITLVAVGGDYDHNGKVEPADYLVWKSTFGTTVTAFTDADGNGNGVVDAADYTIWRNSLGRTALPASGGGAGVVGAAVPEPGSAVLLMLGVGLPAVASVRRLKSSKAR